MKRSLLTLSLATAAALFASSAFPAIQSDEATPSPTSTQYALTPDPGMNGIPAETRLFGAIRPATPAVTHARVSGDRVTVSMTSLPLRAKVAKRLTSESGAFG